MTDNEERDIRQFVAIILKRYDTKSDIIITGGAKGVDTIANEIALGIGFGTKVFYPEQPEWKYYKIRNLQIAKECDELHCITIPVHKYKCYHHEEPQEHEKTAGCWTMNKVLKLGKSAQLMVTFNR